MGRPRMDPMKKLYRTYFMVPGCIVVKLEKEEDKNSLIRKLLRDHYKSQGIEYEDC